MEDTNADASVSVETEKLHIDDTCVPDTHSFVGKRDKWTNKLDFILACLGYAVGLGNIWRFPYLCFKNGGGAFLIPYFICLVTLGVPLVVLEVGLGQYTSLGSIGAWKICPGFAGVGVATVVIAFLVTVYYIIVLAWSIFYLYSSFSTVLPWSTCNNPWNTPRCYVDNGTSMSTTVDMLQNSTSNVSMALLGTTKPVDAVVEFWERHVLQLSDGIDEPGSMVPGLTISLLIAWVMVYFCIWRGVKWTGKVVYFTAIFPYVVLTCLLIRGVTLDGASDGLWFFIKPELYRLKDPQVWIDGGTQIFFSYAVAFGVLVTLGSYNKFNNNFYKDCVIVASINSCTSMYGGVAVFSVLGFMAKQQNVTVAEVAKSGPGLVFIAYPKAVTQMPLPQLWSILFFVMILFVGMDSEFVTCESFLAAVIDMFPKTLSGTKRRMLVTGLYCSVAFLLGLSMTTQGGMYVFQLFDYYSATGLVVLWVAFFECVVVSWVFGAERFQEAIVLMTGRRIPVWFIVCWKYITPTVCLGIFIFMLAVFQPLTYNTYVYPRSAQGFGMCLAIASIVCVPVVFVTRYIMAPGNMYEKWIHVTKPDVKLCNARKELCEL